MGEAFQERSVSTLTDKLPPQNLEAERACLGSMLLDREAIEVAIETLKSDDFYSDQNRVVFSALLDLYNRSTPVDIVTVTEYLKSSGDLQKAGGVVSISSLLDDVPTSANIEYYAKIVEQKSLLRKLIRASSSVIALSHSTERDAYEIVDEAEKLIFDVTERRGVRGYFHLNEVIKDSITAIEKLFHRGDNYTGLPSGYKELDDYTSGFQNSEYIVIAARPSVGKTAFALNIAQNIAIEQKRRVALFSLEMSKEALVQRMLCSEARIDSQRLRKGLLRTEEWGPLTTAAGKLSESNIFIDETPGISDMQLRAKARRIQSRHGLDLVIVDYLQLMSSIRKKEGRTQEISEISRSLKALARELSIPVIALSQLSRAVEMRGRDKRPILSDLRESGAIEQDADVVIFLYRDELYNPNNTDNKGVAEIIIQKQRNGPTGTVELRFFKEFTRFENLEKWGERVEPYYEGDEEEY